MRTGGHTRPGRGITHRFTIVSTRRIGAVMPNTTDDPDTIDTTDPTVAAPEPDATTEQTTAPAAAPAASPSAGNGGRTAAEDKLWTALLANPLRTAEELASTAGIGRSTVSKILT